MFLHGNPVPPERFVGRRPQIKFIASRVAYHGQSTAVIGGPRAGGTSLLEYLASPMGREQIQRRTPTHLLFAYLDAQTLVSGGAGHREFWTRLLEPVLTRILDPASGIGGLGDICRVCKESDFAPDALMRLFEALSSADMRLVALIDEVEHLVLHPPGEPTRFLGTLRSVATRSKGSLALVMASHSAVTALNAAGDRHGGGGSP